MNNSNITPSNDENFKILVVEDDYNLALLIQRKLKRAGHDVIITSTGQACLDTLEKEDISLIFLDYKLPDMNAIEVIKVFKERNLNIPFIIVTGFGDERTAVEIMKLGAKDYIIKDTNLLEFLPAVVKRIKEELKTHQQLSQTQNALQVSEQRYKLLVDNIDLGILLIDNENKIRMTNSALGRMVGKEVDQLIGQDISGVIPFNIPHSEVEQFMNRINSDSSVIHETEFLVDDEKILNVKIRSFPHYDAENNLNGYVEVFEDVTEQKRLEEQLRQAQKMEAIGIMAGGIAHDFNNLLTAIQGHTDLALLQSENSPEVQEDIMGIKRTVKIAADLTKQLLLFSRRQRLKLEQIDINAIIENIYNMLSRVLPKNVLLSINLAQDLWGVKADSGTIDQLIMNLVLNAKDAMPEGGHIIVRTENKMVKSVPDVNIKTLKPGKFIRISIADDGSGMDDKTVKRIFEPFYTTKKAGKGTGLGLAVVYSVVNKHGGIIDVESTLGKGTTFHIYLPAFTDNA